MRILLCGLVIFLIGIPGCVRGRPGADSPRDKDDQYAQKDTKEKDTKEKDTKEKDTKKDRVTKDEVAKDRMPGDGEEAEPGRKDKAGGKQPDDKGARDKQAGKGGKVQDGEKRPDQPTGDGRFQVSVPDKILKFKQGEKKKINIAIERKDGFDQPVRLKLKMPRGTSADPKEVTIPAGESKAEVQVMVDDDALEGGASIEVAASAEGQRAQEQRISIHIDPREGGSKKEK